MDNKRKITFQFLFFDASYRVFRFVCFVVNLVLRFRVEKIPRNLRNYIILFNETRVTNGFIPFIACRKFTHHVVMDYIKGRWYGGMLRAHVDSVFIDQSAPLKAMREVSRKMKKGESFILFPEGRYTQNGITGEISDSTGAFIKSLGHTLVTYRISGGYLRFPTWSVYNRKGPVKGEVAGIYTADQIRSMSAEEISACINRDLHVDDYERQLKDPKVYKGKKLAEGIETVFSICPVCGSFGTIHSKEDVFSCSACGMKGSIDRYGFLSSDSFSFKTFPELEKKEHELFDDYYRKTEKDGSFLIRFGNVKIEKLGADFKPCETASGRLSVYKDRIETEGYEFVFRELREVRVLRGEKNGEPRISVRTENDRYMVSGGNLCPWQVKRTYDHACENEHKGS